MEKHRVLVHDSEGGNKVIEKIGSACVSVKSHCMFDYSGVADPIVQVILFFSGVDQAFAANA
jgi:hypothetical protein